MNQQKMEDAKRIKEIIWREAHKRECYGIHRVVNPNKTGAVLHVNVPLANRSTRICNRRRTLTR